MVCDQSKKCVTLYLIGSTSKSTRCTGRNCSSTQLEVIAGPTTAAVLILIAIVVVIGVVVGVGVSRRKKKLHRVEISM